MNTDIKLRVTEIQRFCMHDGPGIRTTVFLNGCPLRCAWCHNPETQKSSSELLFYQNKCIMCGGCVISCPRGVHIIEDTHIIERAQCSFCSGCASLCPTGAVQICGNDMSVGEILTVIEKDRAFYGENGGVTLSGGEPFAQNENAVAFLKACKEKGFHTAVETCGFASEEVIMSVVPYTDLFLWDLKDTNDKRHEKYTGVSNKKILENLTLADENGAKIRLRCILVNGINTDVEHYRGIADIASSLRHCEGVELLPYHAYAGAKAVFLGNEDNGRKEWIPETDRINKARSILESRGIKVL